MLKVYRILIILYKIFQKWDLTAGISCTKLSLLLKPTRNKIKPPVSRKECDFIRSFYGLILTKAHFKPKLKRFDDSRFSEIQNMSIKSLLWQAGSLNRLYILLFSSFLETPKNRKKPDQSKPNSLYRDNPHV